MTEVQCLWKDKADFGKDDKLRWIGAHSSRYIEYIAESITTLVTSPYIDSYKEGSTAGV